MSLPDRATHSYGRTAQGQDLKIVLSRTEANICALLQDVSRYLKETRPDLAPVQTRIAGGWVRDKLLGKECHDIDVAVDTMMGFDFATHVNAYLKENGYETRNIAKIDSNPAKSKHLETATTRLFGLDVDFANLRTEVYSQDSRIPSHIGFGSPTEDAYRRDITINSLFYNVNAHAVEDFTERGLDDLRKGLIRTPLAPFETFHDDPLRVLRCVRFASRLDFQLVPELAEAAANDVIRDALVHKISRERVGTELDKMLRGPKPLYALQMLRDLRLYPVVFTPPEPNLPEDAPTQAVRALGAVQWVQRVWPADPEALRSLILAASVLPYIDLPPITRGKRTFAPVQLVLRDAIKATNVDTSTTATIFRDIPNAQGAVHKNADTPLVRGELGMLIRDMGKLWQTTLRLALAKDILAKHPEASWERPETIDIDLDPSLVGRYTSLVEDAKKYKIDDCYLWNHMIDSKKLTQVLGAKPGSAIPALFRVMMRWQLDHPNGTEQECCQMLKAHWDQHYTSST